MQLKTESQLTGSSFERFLYRARSTEPRVGQTQRPRNAPLYGDPTFWRLHVPSSQRPVAMKQSHSTAHPPPNREASESKGRPQPTLGTEEPDLECQEQGQSRSRPSQAEGAAGGGRLSGAGEGPPWPLQCPQQQ